MTARPGAICAALFFATYAVALVRLSVAGVYPLEEAIGVLVVLGVGFPGLAWLLLRRVAPLPARAATAGELLTALVLLAVVTVYLAVGTSTVDAIVPAAWLTAARTHAVFVLAKKLVVFVAIPYAVLRLGFGRHAADFGLGREALRALWGRQGVVAVLLTLALGAFQWFVGRGAAPLRAGELTGAALAATLTITVVWNLLEVGLVEEFFFRAVVQTRIADALRSPTAGLFLAALLFGLAHAPGYVLRGAGVADGLGMRPTVADAAAYAIAVPAVASFLFAVLWNRTRNLYVGIIVHAAVDALPQAMATAQVWGLH